MRVLHVVRQFWPSIGGLEDVVLNLAIQQRRRGIDAEVLTLNRRFTEAGQVLPPSDVVAGVPVRRIAFIGSRRYPITGSLLRHVRPFDLIHVHGLDYFADALSATRPLHGKPLVLTTHGGFFHTEQLAALKRAWFQTITRQTLRRFSAVLASSQNDVELFRPITDQRLHRIDNGVAIEKFADTAANHGTRSFVSIGRFARHKGLKKLLAVFDDVCEASPDARLELIGNDWDGTLEEVHTQIARMRHGSSVRVHCGLDDAGVKSVLRDCTYFVSASAYEGFGLALVEAMAAGLVPIVNAIPSFKSVLGDPSLGLLTDFSRPAGEIASDVTRFVRAANADHATQRARCMAVSRRYAWDRVERHYARAYEAVLGVRKRAILGVNISVMSRAAAVGTIDEAASSQRRLNVAFANANTLNIAAGDSSYRAALNEFLALNDGVGLNLASKMKFGQGFAHNLNGTDFIPHYLDRSRRSFRIYLVGSEERVVHKAASTFSTRWPQHQVVGCRNGYFASEDEIGEACRDIRSADADLVLVGMGNPRQELWIARHGKATGATLLFGVGALFDFVTGEVRRAPPWIQRLRCEWVYRLTREPGRLWRRYCIGNVSFLARLMRDRYRVFVP